MTDWTMSTGSSGTMMIRDNAPGQASGTVEFWLNSNNSTTFNHDLPWGYTVNGVTDNTNQFDYSAGAGWKRLGVWTVTTSQTVTFRLFDTGTSGFGGPTTFSHAISRATVPAAPGAPVIGAISSTTVGITFTDGSNGGASIDSRQIGYGTSSSAPTSTMASDGSDTVSGLTPGTLYYFWARTHNSVGYSAWSGRSQATTYRVPDAPSTPIISSVGPVSVVVSWTPNGDGGTAITGYEVGYGTSSSAPTTTVSATSPKTITGLQPGTKYYFWVRAQNSVGWSPYSASADATTIAGVRIKVGTVWKIAIPYVRDGGVWKLARPYVRTAGVWKETI